MGKNETAHESQVDIFSPGRRNEGNAGGRCLEKLQYLATSSLPVQCKSRCGSDFYLEFCAEVVALSWTCGSPTIQALLLLGGGRRWLWDLLL